MKKTNLSKNLCVLTAGLLLTFVLGGGIFGCRKSISPVELDTAGNSETAAALQIDETQKLKDERREENSAAADDSSEKTPTPEETGFLLDGAMETLHSDTESVGDDAGESMDETPEFGEGEDFDVATPENSSISQEELDKYIEDDEYMFEPLALGEPYFENSADLVRLLPQKPIWIDKKGGNIVIQGWICQTKVMLEFFLCQGCGGIRTFPYDDETGKPAKILMFNGTKCHESVICTEVPGHAIQTALLALGAESGQPVQFQPEFKAPTGEEIKVIVRWKKEDGSIAEYRGQDLVVDTEGKTMNVPWVFAGSFIYQDGEGEKRFAADMEGEFIGVSNFPSVILDVPTASSSVNTELSYIANEKVLPERGTSATIILSRVKE